MENPSGSDENEHIVPLSEQSLAIIKSIKAISGGYELLFPAEGDRQRVMSDNIMRRAIFKLGFDGMTPGKSKAVPHGFRATASSILNESGFNPDTIERQWPIKRPIVYVLLIHTTQDTWMNEKK